MNHLTLPRSYAMLAADLVLVPAQPSWVPSETLRLPHEARRFGPRLIAGVILNRCVARSLIASEIAEAGARDDPPALAVRVDQRGTSPKASRPGSSGCSLHVT